MSTSAIPDAQSTPSAAPPGSLINDAQDLLTASAEAAGDSLHDARHRLSAALEGSKRMYGRVKEQVVESARATNSAIHAHPYVAIGIAAGIGAVVGFLLRGRCSHRRT